MNSRSASDAVTEAHAYLAAEYGQDMRTPSGETVVLLYARVIEYEIAWLVPFNTQEFLVTGEPFDGLLPNALVVPKDPAVAPHVPPTAIDVPEYLEEVRSGSSTWLG